MYKYLRQHPQICMAGQKELHFWGEDLAYIGQRDFQHIPRTESEWHHYLGFFPCKDRPICGDASVFYLYSQKAAQEIYQYNPTSKILILLRNPIDVVISMFWENRKIGIETETDLFRAIKRNGPPSGMRNVFLCQFDYIGLARFCAQIERYFQTFPRDQVHVVLLEEMKKDVTNVLRGVYRFLGVEEVWPKDLRPQNVAALPSPLGNRILSMLNTPWARKVGRLVLPSRTLRWRIAEYLKNVLRGRKRGVRPTVSPTDRKKISDLLNWEEEIACLERLLEIPLRRYWSVEGLEASKDLRQANG